jgi:hypothetical protein
LQKCNSFPAQFTANSLLARFSGCFCSALGFKHVSAARAGHADAAFAARNAEALGALRTDQILILFDLVPGRVLSRLARAVRFDRGAAEALRENVRLNQLPIAVTTVKYFMFSRYRLDVSLLNIRSTSSINSAAARPVTT